MYQIIDNFTVHELSTLSLQQIESCIDSNSAMLGQTFVEPGLSNSKIISKRLEDDISGEGRFVVNRGIFYAARLLSAQLNTEECSQNQLIGMLDTLLSEMDVKTKKQKLQEEIQLPMTVKIDQEVSYMCNLSLSLWEKAATEGRMQGVREGRLDSLRDMILDGLTTIDKLRATGRFIHKFKFAEISF